MRYIYWLVVQGNYGQGFEDLDHVCQHGSYILDGKDVSPSRYALWVKREYIVAHPGANYRIINRRELIV